MEVRWQRRTCRQEDPGAGWCGIGPALTYGQAAGDVFRTLIGAQAGRIAGAGRAEQQAGDLAASGTQQHRIAAATGPLAAVAGQAGGTELAGAGPIAEDEPLHIRIAQRAVEKYIMAGNLDRTGD